MATTRATKWLERNPRTYSSWTQNYGSTTTGFGVQFKTSEKLEEYLSKPGKDDHIASHSDTSVDRRRITGSNDIVAVKSFKGKTLKSLEEKLYKMNEELELIHTVAHYHVIEALGSYKCEDEVAFLMKPCADCDLAEALGKFETKVSLRKRMEDAWGRPLEQFVPFTMGCLAHALTYVHSMNIKHKDIKPENILFDGKRVLLTDFGISRSFEDRSTSTGPTSRTLKYAPQETINEDKRGRSQDVFSLACVFVEIFAVYKGFSAENIHDLFEEPKTYAANMDRVLDWVSHKVVERCDVQIRELIRNMTLKERKERLLAREVWEELVTVRSNRNSSIHFCGACCMPRNPSDKAVSDTTSLDPAKHGYEDPLLSRSTKKAGNDTEFKMKYEPNERPPYDWDRNLWLGPSRLVDSVGHSEEEHHLCRKTFWVGNIDDESKKRKRRQEVKRAAKAEAELLEKLAHRHIIKLKGTYRHGDHSFAILLTPVTRYDLSQYLAMVELNREDGSTLGDWQKLLRISLGCLANAIDFLHTRHGLVHGDIEPKNILVAPDAYQKIFLSHFEYAALKQQERDMANIFLGSGRNETQYVNDVRSQNAFASPNHPTLQMVQASDDIFSLGCVFMEMETVRSGKTLEEMRTFLAGGMESQANTNVNDDEEPNKSYRRVPQMQYRRPGVLLKLPEWLKELKPFSTGFYELVASMVEKDQTRRPNAEKVLRDIAECKVNTDSMCGQGCMPIINEAHELAVRN